MAIVITLTMINDAEDHVPPCQFIDRLVCFNHIKYTSFQVFCSGRRIFAPSSNNVDESTKPSPVAGIKQPTTKKPAQQSFNESISVCAQVDHVDDKGYYISL